jgi:hypothetical protein
LAGSQVLQTKAPTIFGRNFEPGVKIRLHHKDLQNALLTAKDLGVPSPLSSFVQQIFVCLIAERKGNEDRSAIAPFFEKIATVEIRSKWKKLQSPQEKISPAITRGVLTKPSCPNIFKPKANDFRRSS